MVGNFLRAQELTLLHNNQETKGVASLPVEYIWKLLSLLPPIQDVPPPQAKKAFSELLPLRSLQRARDRIALFSPKEEGEGLKKFAKQSTSLSSK